MTLDIAQFFGKPSLDLSHPLKEIPEKLDAPEPDEMIEEMMSVRDLERALSTIRRRRRKLDIVGGEVGPDHALTAHSLLTGG